MAKGSLFRSGALAAMVAGLALVSPPVLAQDGPAQWRAQQRGERAERQASERQGGERQAPAWRAQRQAPPPEAQAQTAPRPERAAMRQAPEWQAGNRQGRRQAEAPSTGQAEWRGRRGDDGQRNWRDARPSPAQAPVAQTAPVEQQSRNRSYADPSRDRSYGGDRDRDRREWRDDNRSREGWRDDRGRDTSRDWRYDDRRGDSSRTHWRGNDNRRWDNDNRRWNRDWRRDNRYNWNSYRHSHRHIYRPGRYYAPYRNYYYRPISIGFYMDSLFLTNRYWISDPWHYRLPPAYGPYRWVRYYDDVMLVDIYSGEVVDVIRNFFW